MTYLIEHGKVVLVVARLATALRFDILMPMVAGSLEDGQLPCSGSSMHSGDGVP